jgi:membrane-bound metal-dependent hydrolase YbcI (DUF457 family)
MMFALIVGLFFLLFLGKQRIAEAIAYGLAFASHGILDYMTTKEGGGVELLWPFSSVRLVFGWVGLSELPSRLPAIEIIKSLLIELAVFSPLLLLILAIRKYVWKGADEAGGAI